jgi:hypothetical protein
MVAQGVLLEVRGAQTGHFQTKFRKPKLQSTNYLVGLVRSDRVWNFIQVFSSQPMDPGRFCSCGPRVNGTHTRHYCSAHWWMARGIFWVARPNHGGPEGEEGVLLEVRGALTGHFWAKFVKPKLFAT